MPDQAADQPSGLATIRARLDRLPAGRTWWIGVDGFGAAGKTTFAQALATMINTDMINTDMINTSAGMSDVRTSRAVVVHVDDFARPGVATWDHQRFDAELLTPLLAGRTATYRVWDWASDRPVADRTITPGQAVIVEGVSSTDSALAVPWDLTVWLDASPEVRWGRVLARDPPDLLEVWRDQWIPSEEAYVRRDRPRERVDLVINGEPPTESHGPPDGGGGPSRSVD